MSRLLCYFFGHQVPEIWGHTPTRRGFYRVACGRCSTKLAVAR